MAENNKSPVPSETPIFKLNNHQMSFPEAIKEVIEGKKIARLSWDNPNHYGMLKNDVLCLFRDGKNGDTFYSWIINDGDLLATDWVVVDSLN